MSKTAIACCLSSWRRKFRQHRGAITGIGLGAVWLAARVASLDAQGSATRDAAPVSYVPIGLFFGAIEEGARIFTPTRLLPLEHPEALRHQFPTALRLHGPEFPLLVWLGTQAGYHLWPTLERYPTEPSSDWPYAEFRPPPDTVALRDARVARRPAKGTPLPGLRVVLFDGAELIAFIVDTRAISLEDRGMKRATSMGLDVTRAEFLAALQRAAPIGKASGYTLVVYTR